MQNNLSRPADGKSYADVASQFGYRGTDEVQLWQHDDLAGVHYERHIIRSENGGAAGVPDSYYNNAPNDSDFFNRTDHKWYHKGGQIGMGLIAGTWSSTGSTGSLYSYQALLSQSGTGAPTVTSLGTNGIGAIVWARTATGTYTGTLASAFTLNKTFPQILNFAPAQAGTEFLAAVEITSTSILTLKVYDPGGNLVDGFSNASIKVEVFS